MRVSQRPAAGRPVVLPGQLPAVAMPGIAQAFRDGAPIVALETAVLALGLPYPRNLEVFEAMEAAVREAGAVPAAIALDRGQVRVGLTTELIRRLAARKGVEKTARRDIGRVLASGSTGATTVSSTIWIAHRLGLDVAATGGIGGVHLGAGHDGGIDISADLPTLAETPVLLVSSGVKSICDALATGELLEMFSVPVIGYRTDRFPHFYGGPSTLPIPRIDSPAAAARTLQFHRSAGARSAILVGNPAPRGHRLDANELTRLTTAGMERATREGVLGPALTPYLLEFLSRETGGRTVRANRELLVSNACLAGRIALVLART